MNKYTKIGIIITPIILAGSGVGAYYLIKNQTSIKKTENSSKKVPNIYRIVDKQENNVFPTITFDEVYDDIVMENEIPIINDSMIAKFIKLIFMRINVSVGKIKTSIFYNNRQEVDIQFQWIMDGKVKDSKIYKMKLKY